MVIRKVRKRTGEIVPFKPIKIQNAIEKAMLAINVKDSKKSRALTTETIKSLNSRKASFLKGIPDIEQIQDAVEDIDREHYEVLELLTNLLEEYFN